MLRLLRTGNKRIKVIWWILVVITVVTFVFLFGAGFDSSARGRQGTTVGQVNGEPIGRNELQMAIEEQKAAFRQQYGSDPADRDARMVETQAWRALVAQRLLADEAKRVGLKPTDREVVLILQNSPPSQVTANPAFQTDGKFDIQKYQTALRDPNNHWGGFEDLVRQQLPVRKLQERLLSSIKLSEPELRAAFRDLYESLQGVAVQIAPNGTEKVSPPTPADLDRVYEKYKSRFHAGPRVELELVTVPKKYADEDVRAARQLAVTIAERARAGEDFAALARDYSEGPAADRGGVMDRVIRAEELGPELGTALAELPAGAVTNPFVENGRVLVLKVLERVPNPMVPTPGLRLAQIVIKVHPNENSLQTQYDDVAKLRARAAQLKNLGKAALEKSLATTKSGTYDASASPPSLMAVPDAMDWGLQAKAGEVSPIFEGTDEFVVAQVSAKHDGGTLSRGELEETLRQIADVEARVNASEGRAKQVKAALDGGATLEQAAAAGGATAFPFNGLTRLQPDPRLAQVPEVIGALFATAPGTTVGPLRGVNGWYFARIEHRFEPVPAMYDSMRGQISTQILTQRQRAFFAGWVQGLQAKAKVEDKRRSVAN